LFLLGLPDFLEGPNDEDCGGRGAAGVWLFSWVR
jgi:hypothetical protein